MIIKIFDNEFVRCELDDSLPVLRHFWKTEPPGEVFKANLLKILEEFKALKRSYRSLAWLADTTHLGELDEDTEKWLEMVWEDLLFVRAELKIHAVILGSSLYADYPMEMFKLNAEEKFKSFDVHLGVFSSVEEAYEWIKEKQVQIIKK